MSFNFMAAVTICSDFGSPKIKSVTVSIVSASIYYEVMGLDAMIFIFSMLSFKPAVSFSSFTYINRLFNSSLLSAIRVVSYAFLRLMIFLPTSHAPSLITIKNQPYCTGIQNAPLGSRCCFCDEPLTRVTPCWVVYGGLWPPKVWFRFESLAWQDQPGLGLCTWMISPNFWMNWGRGSWDGGLQFSTSE